MRWLINNLPFKIFSLILSLILWLYVAGELERGLWWKNRRATLSHIPVKMLVASGYGFTVDISPEAADIVLSGYGSVGNVESEDIVLYVDLGDLQAGTYELYIQSIAPKELNIEKIIPHVVKATVKEKLLESPATTPVPQNEESLQE